MWSGNVLASAGKLGYNIILGVTLKTPAENSENKTREYASLRKHKNAVVIENNLTVKIVGNIG